MKKNIYNFNEFVNEGYLSSLKSKIGSTLRGWSEGIKRLMSSGIMSKVKSGPKTGKPVATYFDPNDGDLVRQIEDYYKGIDFGQITEQVVGQDYPQKFDVPNVGVDQMKSMLKLRLREILEIADQQDSGELDPETALELQREQKPYFIFGSPGIGKTRIVAQVCKELGQELYGKQLGLLVMEGLAAAPEDFAGVPSVVTVKQPTETDPLGQGMTRSNPSANLLPYDNGRDGLGGIIFIDEMNRMDEPVQKVFLKLVQERSMGGGYVVPNRWYFVAAGNRPEDELPGKIEKVSNALRDRFTMINFVNTPAALRKHVESSRYKDIVLPELLDFFDFQAEWFHNLDPKKGLAKYPTPRAWMDASVGVKTILKQLKREGVQEIPEKDLLLAFQSEVGYEAANAFMDFYRVAKEIPVKDLMLPFTDPDKAPLPDAKKTSAGKPRPDYAHALLSAVIRKSMDSKLTEKEICNFASYLKRVDSPEWGNAAISNLVKAHPYMVNDSKSVACLAPIARKWGADLGFEA